MKLGMFGRVSFGAALTILAACGGESDLSDLSGSPAGTSGSPAAGSTDAKTTTTVKSTTTVAAAKGITGAKVCAAVSSADAGKVLGDTVGTGTPIDTNLTKSHFCEFTSTGGAAKGKVQVEMTENFPVEADRVAQMGKIGLTVPNVGDKAFYRKVATDGGRISVHKGALVYWVVVTKPGATPDQLLPGMTDIVNKLLTIS